METSQQNTEVSIRFFQAPEKNQIQENTEWSSTSGSHSYMQTCLCTPYTSI